MIRLSQHIAYLLTRHDCVVVPGFGAFIVNAESARYDAASGIFTPPVRRLSFNPGLTHNDGMLAASVARREEIGYDLAAGSVTRSVDMMRYTLARDGELRLPGVGLLTAADNASPSFEPDPACSANFCYGCLPVLTVGQVCGEYASSQAVTEEARTESVVIDREVVSEAVGRRRRRVPAFVGVAASVALLLGLGFGLTSPGVTGESRTDYASVGSIALSTTPTAVAGDTAPARELCVAMPGDDSRAEVDTAAHSAYCSGHRYGVATTDEFRTTPTAPVQTKPRKNVDKNTATAEPEPNTRSAGGYCLVVASLHSREKAERFIRESGDKSLRILNSGRGRYRVYIATAATKEGCQALARTKSIAARYPDAWACER